jgi:thymidylate kinase
LVRSGAIENNLKIYKDFFVANTTIDAAMHFMYPLAHFGKIPEKYKKDIRKESTQDKFWKIIESGWGIRFGQEIRKLILQNDWHAVEDLFRRRRRSITLYALRQLTWSEVKLFLVFISTNIERLFQPKGLFIAFIGPDGCGKTTVIENLNTFFDKGFTKGKVKKFYWRPFLLPRLKALTPHSGKVQKIDDDVVPSARLELRNANMLQRIAHSMKLLYYWVDYLTGRIKYQGAWSRGGVVCFDRYWDDLLVFPERFGLNVPRLLIKVLGLLVPKPDLVFYLHAEGYILMERKPELPSDEIARHVRDYKNLAATNDRVVLIDGNRSVHEVVAAVITACLNKMSERYHDVNV